MQARRVFGDCAHVALAHPRRDLRHYPAVEVLAFLVHATRAGLPARYPRLSGQHADYTFAQLQAFKAGTRGMDKEGKDLNGRVMAQIAARMSERDMRAVAEYTSGLH